MHRPTPPPRPPRPELLAGVRLLLIVAVAATAALVGCDGGDVVIYCAHDSVYSEQILQDFEDQTGIRLDIRFDTEATKSLGLTELLVREKNNPRCDVFWNNEPLGMMRLKEAGVLEVYKGPGYERIPVGSKDAQGYWTGFAARMRVWIINTDAMEPTDAAVEQRLAGDLSRVAIAKALYGTTRMHYTVLWDHLGAEAVRQWHENWRGRSVVEAAGNAHVKNLVAAGTCDLGLTDTDDFFVAKDAGRPVAMLPFRLEDGRAMVIPNTVALIHGARHPENARKLIEFLLSKETELALSRSASRQIPLGPVDEWELPEQVRRLKRVAERSYPIGDLDDAARVCLAWLKGTYLQ